LVMGTSGKPLVVGLGEILWDLLPAGSRLGGAPANFAFHAHMLGGEGIPLSCVGNDDPGREIFDRLAALGLRSDFIAVDRDHETGTVSVQLNPAGEPSYVIHRDVAWDFIPFGARQKDLAGRADAVCFGSLAQRSPVSASSIRSFLDATRPSALRIFDVNLREQFYGREVIEASLLRANVLKINEQELPVMARLLGLEGETHSLMWDIIRLFDLWAAALTRGAYGSVLFSGGRFYEHAGVPVEVVDTVGAGDAFTAALAMGFLNGLAPDAVNERANRVAAFVCSQQGATPELPAELRTTGT
jgi:fructokinase